MEKTRAIDAKVSIARTFFWPNKRASHDFSHGDRSRDLIVESDRIIAATEKSARGKAS